MGGSSRRTTTGATGGTAQLQNDIYNTATSTANGGAPNASPYLAQAGQGFTAAQGAGETGLNAIQSGNYSAFMNPYQQQVINSLQPMFQQQNQGALNAVNQQATAQGAFGGSRQGVAEGTALASNQLNQNNLLANLEQSGFNTATSNALNAANLGMGASSGLAGLGQYDTGLAFQRAMFPEEALTAGMQGGGTQSTQTTQQTSGNPLNAVLGIGGLAASFIPGGGAISGLFHDGAQSPPDAWGGVG